MLPCLSLSFQVSVQHLAAEKNEGGDRGESGAAFSRRGELADTQRLPHPNYCLCRVALGAERDAGFVAEVLSGRACRDTSLFPWFTPKDC